MVLSESSLEEILKYLEKSINNLAKESLGNLEIEGGFEGFENFLQSQFDIRLENMLVSKNSSIHHLESGMKNRVIQRKKKLIENILEKSR
ncbi:MAG: hypothetical protein HKM23_01195 [Nitrosopumilus sp.]|nr:hypothetical protein [Nitrosopumilus sp.]NNL58311.1 hypothetical protein [Nitrosopumilus sp.]